MFLNEERSVTSSERVYYIALTERISEITLVWFDQMTKFGMVTQVGSSVFSESPTPSIRMERSLIAHRLGETTTAFAILPEQIQG